MDGRTAVIEVRIPGPLPPTAKLPVPKNLDGVTTATFDKDVKGVTSSTFAARLAEPHTALAASLTCKNVAGHAVSCGSGPVRSATLDDGDIVGRQVECGDPP